MVEHGDGAVPVPFPVCLAIKYGRGITEDCPDFILNTKESWVFVKTESPLPEGAALLMHFYIPPEKKLLAELKGWVGMVNRWSAGFSKGMLIMLESTNGDALENLEDYAEGKKHLVDKVT